MSRHSIMRLLVALAGCLAFLATASSAGPVAANAAQPGAVPRGFVAQSVAPVDSRHVRVLGYSPCGTRRCSRVVDTDDGGKTWSLVGTIPAPIASLGQTDRGGLAEIRFATPEAGWAFGNVLFRTRDGGRTWRRQPIPGNGAQVLDIATNDTTAFAYVSGCDWARLCKRPSSLWRSPVAGGPWTRIRLDLPASPMFFGNHYGADIAVSGDGVYVVDTASEEEGKADRFYASTDGGDHFTPRSVPCDQSPHPGPHWLTGVATASATSIAVLCGGNAGFSKSEKSVFRSKNSGKTFTYAGTAPDFGLDTMITASPSGNLAMASSSNGSFIYTNDTGAREWIMRVAYGDGGRGWNDITFVTDRVGWVVYSPAAFFDGIGKLFVTRDGGHKWYLVSRVTPH